MERRMSYPLFDGGFTLWAGDLETRLKEQWGTSSRDLGVDPGLLRHSYYSGFTISAALALIASRYAVPGG